MAGALFSRIKVWVKEKLKYVDINAEFDNILNNFTPSMMDDYSTDTSQYQEHTLPSAGSLPTSLAQELKQLRGAIAKIQGTTYWYSDPTFYHQASPIVSLVWKDAATVTVQAGNYFIGGKIYTLSSGLDWTWAASGQNRGLDTGTETSSEWYFLYGVVYGGSFGIIASLAYPTARFNTNLSGSSYDTNVYLGAVYNNSGSDLRWFRHSGNKFYYNVIVNEDSCTATSYTSFTCSSVPNSAASLIGHLSLDDDTYEGAISADGTNLWAAARDESDLHIEMPFYSGRSFYMLVTNVAATVTLYVKGWVDKWL